jgi:poly(3-hydroxybutyrate) depolymerase
MLYEAYLAQRDALAPLRFFAEAARSVIGQPWPVIGDHPLIRGTAAALDLFSHSGLSHERAPFGIAGVTIDGVEIPVTEEIVSTHPFCRLVHFCKAADIEQPKLLMVAPL